ncbi:MAG: DUF4258 domain-containing protein [Betaproteobacteria bacterium]|nr:DUF4258 domain-containing protein [Betaproteobacteria bacterium]
MPPEIPAFVLTEHAKVVLAERGIPLAWVERALARPQRTAVDDADPELRHAIAAIPEHGDRYLRVIYNFTVAPWRVVTAYFDRGLRGE